jgi:hypothetical protein
MFEVPTICEARVPFEPEVFRKVREEQMASRGWGVVKQMPQPGDSVGAWSYTVGLTTRGLPELLTIGLGDELEELGRRVWERGHTYTDGERVTDAGPREIEIRDATLRAVQRPELAQILYGDEVRLQQVIVADGDGRFPWDTGVQWAPPVLAPPPPQQRSGWLFRIDQVILLPLPDPVTDPPCMADSRSRARHLVRRIVPGRTLRDCCWFHGVDWAAASEAAIAVLPDGVLDPTRTEGRSMSDPAARTLLAEPINTAGLDADVTYRDGRRRLRAMLDQGVRRTVLAQWYVPASITY